MKKLLILLAALGVLLSCGSQDKPKVKILAHRGLCTTGVNFTTDENTLEALRRAQMWTLWIYKKSMIVT